MSRPVDRRARVNDAITAPVVLLVGRDGTRVGEVPRADALARARAAGVDLVEVGSGADPPVCRLMDLAKERYAASVRARQATRARVPRTREIKLAVVIGEHDYQVKVRKISELLARGDRVKVSAFLHGRLRSKPELADALVARVTSDLAGVAVADPPRRTANTTVTVLSARVRPVP